MRPCSPVSGSGIEKGGGREHLPFIRLGLVLGLLLREGGGGGTGGRGHVPFIQFESFYITLDSSVRDAFEFGSGSTTNGV